jgi:hypothetical protein
MWDGDPLEVTSAPQRLYIDGVLQDTETRQSRLRQRYLEPGKGDRPQAYIKP